MHNNLKITKSLYVLINLIFICKYANRINLVICVIAIISYYGINIGIWSINLRKYSQISDKLFYCTTAIFIIILMGMQYYIDPDNLKVDRWSAIHNFIAYLFEGKYPYMAQTHLGGYGSPFPIWQIVHIPFYILGNVGLSVFASLSILLFTLKKIYNNATATQGMFLFALSPSFIYEVAVRSDLISNFIIVASTIIWLYHKKITLHKHFKPLIIMTGLLMSTRLAAIIPLGLMYFRAWCRLHMTQKVEFAIGIITIFVLTFLPLLLWDYQHLLFFRYNPFVLQSRQGHLFDFLIFVPLFIFSACQWDKKRQIQELFRACTNVLLTLVILTFAHNMIKSGNYDLFSSTYDITYLNMAMPFIICMICLSNKKNSYP